MKNGLHFYCSCGHNSQVSSSQGQRISEEVIIRIVSLSLQLAKMTMRLNSYVYLFTSKFIRVSRGH